MDPVKLLNSPDAMQRVKYLLSKPGDDVATADALLDRVRTNLSTEVAKAGTASRVPTEAGLTTSAAEKIGALSFGEQVVPFAAMGAFSPFFAAGRKSAEMLRWLRGLSNTQIGRQKLRGMMSLDPGADEKFVEAIIPRIEEYARESSKLFYPGERAVRGLSYPALTEGGQVEDEVGFGRPKRREYTLGLLGSYNPF